MAGGVRNRVKGHAKAVADEVGAQVSDTTKLAGSAASSTAWVYPLRGVGFILTHSELYTPLKSAIGSTLVMALIVTFIGFGLFYLPQVAFLALFTGPLAFIAAFPLVLSEISVTVLALGKLLYLDNLVEDVFDATLLVRGHDELVKSGRTLGKKGGSVSKRLGKRISGPLSRFSAANIARYLISLPLNAIPGIGTVLFLLFNGSRAGPTYHDRYFNLKKLDQSKKDAFIKSNRGGYTSFGVMATALQLVPVVGLLFSLTNSVGAALWAADIESSNALAKMGDVGETKTKQTRSEL